MRLIKHKFGAKPTKRDGKKFPSRLEAHYYDQLKLRQRSGEVLFFLCQTRFDLPGDVVYRCDYTVFNADGTVDFIDCKGVETALSMLKIKQVEDIYPVKIKIVKKV